MRTLRICYYLFIFFFLFGKEPFQVYIFFGTRPPCEPSVCVVIFLHFPAFWKGTFPSLIFFLAPDRNANPLRMFVGETIAKTPFIAQYLDI